MLADLRDGHALAMDGLDGHGGEVAEGVGAEEEGVVLADQALQARTRHHRPHSRHQVRVVDLAMGSVVLFCLLLNPLFTKHRLART